MTCGISRYGGARLSGYQGTVFCRTGTRESHLVDVLLCRFEPFLLLVDAEDGGSKSESGVRIC